MRRHPRKISSSVRSAEPARSAGSFRIFRTGVLNAAHGCQDPEERTDPRRHRRRRRSTSPSAEGLEAITLQAVADRIGLSKSGVFSRVGSREALQKAVIEEFGRRYLADVFVPAMQLPKGLPRLDNIMQRWIVRTRDIDAERGCIYSAGAFELDDREGPLRDLLHSQITGWRAALRRTVLQAMEAGHLKPDTDPEQLVSEMNALILGLIHDTRFLRDSRAAERAQATWRRLLATYQPLRVRRDMSPSARPPIFRTNVRRKESTMLTLLILAAAYGGWRVVRAALESLRSLPRSNDDMVFF